MLYMPGKILKVFSPEDGFVESSDASVQATVKMWDENVITFAVELEISKKVRKEDIVLVDYSPGPTSPPTPIQKIVKIIKGKEGSELWKIYEKFAKERKERAKPREQMPEAPPGGYT